MRILVVSSFYPPDRLGGYELGCQDLVEALQARGHLVKILAGFSPRGRTSMGEEIHRSLITGSKVTSDWRGVFFKEWTNQTAFRNMALDFSPDVTLFFDLSQVSVSLVWLAERMAIPFSFYLADNWFAIWEKDQWRQLWPAERHGFRTLRWLSRRFGVIKPETSLSFDRAIFASRHLRGLAIQLGQAREAAAVVPWGVDLDRFCPPKSRESSSTRLLYVGQLMPHKGLDVAIKALAILKKNFGGKEPSFTVVEVRKDKSGPHYKSYFEEIARSLGVEDLVRFETQKPRQHLPDIYRAHDIFIFPPAGDDSLSLRLLEAMASGMAVVSTPTRGNADILEEEQNALIFPAENAEACAQQIQKLLESPRLFERLTSAARKKAEQSFALDKTVSAIEEELAKVGKRGPAVVFFEKPIPRADVRYTCRRLRRWLAVGAVAVTARALLKPGFYGRILKKMTDKGASLAALLVFPICLEIFFKLAGRRRQAFRPGDGPVAKLRNVIVVQLADMGDVLLSGPFLRELRRAAPRARLILAVQPSMSSLVENCPYVDELVFFPWRSARNWRNAFTGSPLWWWQALWITARRLWKRHIDTAISLRWNNDPCQAASLILMYASGAAKRIGYHDFPHHLTGYKLTDVNRLITLGPVRGFPEHEIERQLDLLSFLGLNPDKSGAGMELWTTEEDNAFAADVLKKSGLARDELLVAFAPGAAWEFRRWPAERFVEVGRWLQECHGAFVLIFAARNEHHLALQVEKGLYPGQTLNLAGQTTIPQMGALLRHCRLFLGNDSGPLHVAVAAGVPVVGLFGPGEYERFRPWGPANEVIRLTFPCSPCSQSCFFESARCIRGISVSQVKETIVRKLGLE